MGVFFRQIGVIFQIWAVEDAKLNVSVVQRYLSFIYKTSRVLMYNYFQWLYVYHIFLLFIALRLTFVYKKLLS